MLEAHYVHINSIDVCFRFSFVCCRNEMILWVVWFAAIDDNDDDAKDGDEDDSTATQFNLCINNVHEAQNSKIMKVNLTFFFVYQLAWWRCQSLLLRTRFIKCLNRTFKSLMTTNREICNRHLHTYLEKKRYIES